MIVFNENNRLHNIINVWMFIDFLLSAEEFLFYFMAISATFTAVIH